jgi:GAF domain-containing protein
MGDPGRFEAAVAAEVIAASSERGELLQWIAELARVVFGAEAASIARLDAGAREPVFEAVAGQGADALVGARFAAGEGVAGRAIDSGQAVVVDELSHEPGFARDVAVETGYMPETIMAAPLVRDERTIGVLSVLDRRPTDVGRERDLLDALAGHAALALDHGEAARRAARALEGVADAATVARLARRLDALASDRREAGMRLLEAIERVLG